VARGPDSEPRRPDVEIGARCWRLRFRKRPKVKVEFAGEGHRETRSASESERVNLPEQVEPGVTYRDVEVRWRAGSRIVDSDE
jgi:hypothetical protein